MFVKARVALVSLDARHLAVLPKIGTRNRLTMRTHGSKLADRLRLGTISLTVGLLTTVGATARAGGGPENVFLLVNSHSEASKTIANHYIQLRDIPASNVFYLNWQGSLERVRVSEFRQKILQPALAAMHERGLGQQIDYLVYSSDFPWSVGLKSDFFETKLPKHLRPIGSITGVTYLWRFTQAKSLGVLAMDSNRYASIPKGEDNSTVSRGFRSLYGWGTEGELLIEGGPSYLLSTMLAVTSGRGNTVDEAIAYLARSAQADGTRPSGTIYYVKNKDVRSQARHDAFPHAVAELQSLGVNAQIVGGKVPKGKKDVQGAMLGTANFDWAKSGSQILPGAICEHFTSYGGVMTKEFYQTPLSEFLRYGAAGTSGTVTEPIALPMKFPHPAIHVHYARGCTLAEAFYQSVTSPYQLLIVGDPLCRPWAVIPEVSVRGLRSGQVLQGTVNIAPSAQIAGGAQVAWFELFVDGRRVAVCRQGETMKFDTTKLVDGHHELRVVAIDASPIQTQGRVILPVQVNNHGHTVQLSLLLGATVPADMPVTLTAMSDGAEAIIVLHNRRQVGRLAAPRGRIEIPAGRLGRGEVVLQAVALGERKATSQPIKVRIQ